MKSRQTVIPKKMREEMVQDPFYRTCALYGHHGHECDGRITWEHALIYAGKKIQKKFAIIPLCEKAHAVDHYQDAGTMNKELNQWVALSRATPSELAGISKAVDMAQYLRYLQNRWGIWRSKAPMNTNPAGIQYPVSI